MRNVARMGMMAQLLAMLSTNQPASAIRQEQKRISRRQWRRLLGGKPPTNGHRETLRRRMGGNAHRIRMAREGFVYNDDQSLPTYGRWKLSPTVLPEEVEMRHHEMVLDARMRPSEMRRWGNWFPCDGGYYVTEIRGMKVQIFPRFCGPVRFTQPTEAA